MKEIYIGYDSNFYVNQYSEFNQDLTLAYMDDDFQIEFGYTKVKIEEDKYILYNQKDVNKLYVDPSEEEQFVFNLRKQRAILLEAFDKYKSNVNYGVVTEDEETRARIVSWYNDLLNLVESAFEEENIPSEISYYL